MFALTMPLWEIASRATVVYVALVLLVRFSPKRNAGQISPSDMLFLILVGAMGGDAIMGGSGSVGDIVLMIAVVFAWSYVQDLLEFRYPLIHRLLRDRGTPLIENGRILRDNMRREMITRDELMAVLRKRGIDKLSAVRAACLEPDGDISVIGSAHGLHGDLRRSSPARSPRHSRRSAFPGRLRLRKSPSPPCQNGSGPR